MPIRGARILLTLLMVAVCTGCGRSGSPLETGTTIVTPTVPSFQATALPATPAPREPRFSEIVWTNEWSGQPGEEPVALPELLPDSPVIVALTRARALPPEAQVEATWTYNDTTLDAFSTGVVNSGAHEDVWLAFRLTRDPETVWPAGTYEVTLLLNGVEVTKSAIQVIESP
ncbi:MAG: hypothetical protein AB7V46_18095 [Thermomicrobiales bacterium]